MYILVTNDDGIDAPGLLALKQALERIAQVKVLAPDRNWSAAGHTKTMSKPLRVNPVTFCDGTTAYSTDGAPTDCVALVMLGLFGERPALVVSGINPGSNLAHDLTYSGTVAAAMEAAIHGVPGIAVSIDANPRGRDIDFTPAAEVAWRVARRVLMHGLPHDTFLNVNVPNVPFEQIQGVCITRMGKRVYRDELIARRDPYGREYYWIGGQPPGGNIEEDGTDLWAVAQRFVSITPVQLDMTHHAFVARLKDWENDSLLR